MSSWLATGVVNILSKHRASIMVPSASHRSSQYIETCVAEALRQGVLRRRDHLKLTAALLSSPLSDGERQQINQVFDLVRAGRIQLAD